MVTNKCRFCGKGFLARTKRFACRDCQDKDNEFFAKVEQYLDKYPNSNAIQIAEGLGVSAMEILYYIDEGRLQINRGEFGQL